MSLPFVRLFVHFNCHYNFCVYRCIVLKLVVIVSGSSSTKVGW